MTTYIIYQIHNYIIRSCMEQGMEELAKIARRKKVTTQGCIISRSGKD